MEKTRSGRVQAVTPDDKGGVVRDSDGREYAFQTDGSATELRDDIVLFELVDVMVNKKPVTKVAKIIS